MIRPGYAEIKTIENGFLLYHDYPNAISARPMYFATLDELFAFLKEKVFADIR